MNLCDQVQLTQLRSLLQTFNPTINQATQLQFITISPWFLQFTVGIRYSNWVLAIELVSTAKCSHYYFISLSDSEFENESVKLGQIHWNTTKRSNVRYSTWILRFHLQKQKNSEIVYKHKMRKWRENKITKSERKSCTGNSDRSYGTITRDEVEFPIQWSRKFAVYQD